MNYRWMIAHHFSGSVTLLFVTPPPEKFTESWN